MGTVVEPHTFSDTTNPESPDIDLKKSKKKKRKSDTEAAAAVPVPVPARTMNVKVEMIRERSDRTSPVVGYFPTGYSPQNVDENDEPSPLPKVNLYKNVQRTKIDTGSEGKSASQRVPERLELVVTPGEGSKVDFVGTSYRGEASNAQLATYALGVLDKETNTLKIMPIAGNKIFRMEPVFRGRAKEEQSTEKVSALDLAAKKSKTVVLYAPKKTVARDKKMQNLTQGFNAESQPDLGVKIGSIPVNQEALTVTALDVARNIPPHNSSATTPREAYPLDRIIATRDWQFLGDIDRALKAGEVVGNAYPMFVRNRIRKLQQVQDEAERETLSGILCYITHLIKFKDSQWLDTAESAKNHRFPNVLRQKFNEMFKSSDSKRMSGDQTNLLINYVLVLSLHADNFQTDPADIAKDLGKNLLNVRQHFEYLGCKMVTVNKTKVYTLPVPVQFPEPKRKRKRG